MLAGVLRGTQMDGATAQSLESPTDPMGMPLVWQMARTTAPPTGWGSARWSEVAMGSMSRAWVGVLEPASGASWVIPMAK